MTQIPPTLPAPNASISDPERRKLEKAAQDFEGLLMNSLWKTMGDSMKSQDDSANSTFTDMGIEAMSSAMAASGGLGIGRMLLKALDKAASEGHGPKT